MDQLLSSSRRSALKAMVTALILPALLPGCATVAASANPEPPEDNASALQSNPPEASTSQAPQQSEAIRFLQLPDPTTTRTQIQQPHFAEGLAQATWDLVAAIYPTGLLPLWKLPLSQVDLLPRIRLAAEALVPAVHAYATIYPVDPIWIMGQILAESLFWEFAISSSLAVGMCQFIGPTAKEYGMLTADAPSAENIALAHLQPEAKRADQLRAQARDLRRAHPDLFSRPEKTLYNLLKRAKQGENLQTTAGAWLATWEQLDRIQAQRLEAVRNFRSYLEANFHQRSIFNPDDVAFLERFDQRTLPQRAVPAMVRMMARHLRARNGNILAATAGYNAGLGTTETAGPIYAQYGRIPAIEETVTYVSRILIHYHEIRARLGV